MNTIERLHLEDLLWLRNNILKYIQQSIKQQEYNKMLAYRNCLDDVNELIFTCNSELITEYIEQYGELENG